uniref:GATA-type domain-containing protein n=1 Tax=Ananas comosus var. bracteatus TaxID=296719 RepID=A0A6V7PGV3_ANACO|nr:unnamed protein product [Ananas comosus var. bracteatus]
MGSLDEKGAGSVDRGSGGEERRCCADCRTTKTPLWRGGPSVPRCSLCNACGIRYRKRRRETARSKEGERRGEGEGIGVSLKLRLLEDGVGDGDGDGDGVVVKPRSTMAEATKKRMG